MALPDYCIAPARSDDAASLSHIHAESLGSGWSEQEFSRLLCDPATVGLNACSAGPESAMLGFVLARAAADEAEILALAVTGKARCQGVARALVERLCAELATRGAAALYLEVAEDNHAARALYGRLGFRRAGKRENYYHGPRTGQSRDAFILRLDLTAS